MARFLQDIATDDWDDAGVASKESWVVRRTALRVAEDGRWPTLGELLSITTWCGGSGAAWAERRTDFFVDGEILIEAVALWVPVDPSGQPRRLSPSFFAVYGEATAGRRVSGRVAKVPVTPGADRRPWPVRRADLDVAGHVNNAAIWCALSEVANGQVAFATMTHHVALEGSDEVTLATDAGRLWLLVEDDVRVSGEFVVR